MLSDREIDKIVRNLYPSSAFSRKERKHLRQAIKEEIAEYLDAHPNATYEDIQRYYADNEVFINQQEPTGSHMTKLILFMGLLILILCAIFYAISNSWIPPTYTI